MNQLSRITNEEIFIDTLIIEPTFFCARNCKNCYSRAHEPQGPEVGIYDWIELFSRFMLLEHKEHSVNQICISVNDRNQSNWSTVEGLILINSLIRKHRKRKNTRVHLTLFSPSTIKQYNLPMDDWASVDSIYFSNIFEKELGIISDLRTLNKNLEIGWNSLPPSTITGKVFRELDGVYYLINKSRDNGYRLTEELYCAGAGPKIQNDICWRDYTNWKKDWRGGKNKNAQGCSANISKFTIWPDGSVSGCPYAKQSNTGPAITYKDILNNIVKASEYYDFNKCPMKEIYK